MSNVSNEWRSGRCLHDNGGLSSSRAHNGRPSWTVEHNWSLSNGNGYQPISREEPKSVRLSVEICPFCFRHIDLFLCSVWHLCDLPCGVYALVTLISIEKYVLKFLSVGFQFEGQSLKYFVSVFQRKVDNWKPQAGGHVTGLYRRSIIGQNDLLKSLPTGVLSLPLIELFLSFLLFSVLHSD